MSSKLASGIVSKGTSYNADVSALVVRPNFNPRFDLGDIEELASGMLLNGFYKHKPIVVKRVGTQLEIVDGHRRFAAIQHILAKPKHKEFFAAGVPIVIESPDINEIDSLVLTITANNGLPLNPLESAAAYKRMQDGGLTIPQIAKKISRSVEHVTDRISLVTAAPETSKAIEDKEIGSTLAERIVKEAKGDKKKEAELVAKATSSKRGKREVTAQVEKRAKPLRTQREIRSMLEQANKAWQEGEVYKEPEDALADAKNDQTTNEIFMAGVMLALEFVLGESELKLTN